MVETNFIGNFLHGTPYSTADFSPQEFQTNRSVTVKVLSLLDAKQLCHTEKLSEWTPWRVLQPPTRPSGFQATLPTT